MATHSITNVLEITAGARGRVAESAFSLESEKDGLGCMRGLAFAMVFNVIMVVALYFGWEIWKHLR